MLHTLFRNRYRYRLVLFLLRRQRRAAAPNRRRSSALEAFASIAGLRLRTAPFAATDRFGFCRMQEVHMPAAAVSFSPDFRQRLEWSERLRDGYVVSIRPIRPGDAQREREFLARLPSEFRAYRFLGLIKRPDDAVAHELTHVDPACEFALVAIARNDEVGVAQYRTRGNGTCCDCSVTVDPLWQQRGVGRLLMLHLIDVARWRGIQRMYAVDPVRCAGAHKLAERLGFHCRPDPEDPIVTTFELVLR